MPRETILLDLDREISRLQQVRGLLSGASSPAPGTTMKRKPGRPLGTGALSVEARRRIAKAMKKSWAARKKAAAQATK